MDHRPANSADNSIWEEDELNKMKVIGRGNAKTYKQYDIILVKHLVSLINNRQAHLVGSNINAKPLHWEVDNIYHYLYF